MLIDDFFDRLLVLRFKLRHLAARNELTTQMLLKHDLRKLWRMRSRHDLHRKRRQESWTTNSFESPTLFQPIHHRDLRDALGFLEQSCDRQIDECMAWIVERRGLKRAIA